MNKRLDELDLDDILSRAEKHDTIATDPAGSSLGGEQFLQQFAEVTDVKNDINWDEIIPLEERDRVTAEDEQRNADAFLLQQAQGRKRAAAAVSYEGMDMLDPAVATAGDKKKPLKPVPTQARKSANAKSMELKDRDIRVLARSMQRWGDVRRRYEVIVSMPGSCTYHISHLLCRFVTQGLTTRTKASSTILQTVFWKNAKQPSKCTKRRFETD